MSLNSLTKILWHENCLVEEEFWAAVIRNLPCELETEGVRNMADETKVEEVQGVHGRRKFLKTAAQVAITAPAAVILLNATTIRPAAAAYGIDNATATGNTGTGGDDAGSFKTCGSTSAQDGKGNNPIDCPPVLL